jgi:PPOX class probable FMN-dependent enzyme
MGNGDVHHLDTVEKLRAIVPEPAAGIALKLFDHVDEDAAGFIALSPFLVLSTSDAEGRQDASPKGDDPGFVMVEDGHTLLIPDRPGNRLAYGLNNIVANPRVGLIFMVPGTTETLRVNGSAELRSDPELLTRLEARGKPAVLVIRVTVEECFFHCSKAFIRSQLWKHDTWPEKQKISFGTMVAKRLKSDDPDLPGLIDAGVEEDARTNL